MFEGNKNAKFSDYRGPLVITYDRSDNYAVKFKKCEYLHIKEEEKYGKNKENQFVI